ncbi:hypothetical protein EDC04DRAFT_2910902 [Pisolithus marmoratus]|nr:hypothetical protein EDC04DRAFT_2910902 [Pisolithus marmoratus]
MFFRIFWFKRKQRPAPSSTPRSAKASTRPKPLSLPEYPASTLAQDSAPGSLSPIIFVNRDPKPVSSYAGHVHISANPGSGIFSLRPGMPRKKRHVSFVVIESGAEAGLASSPPTPYPFPSSISPSSSPLNRESVSSVSTLVDADQLPPKPSAVDALAWEDILNESVSSAAGGQEPSYFDASVLLKAPQSKPILCSGSYPWRADASDAIYSIRILD